MGKKLPTFSLDTAVRFANPADQAAFVEELANTVARLAARYQNDDNDQGRWFRVTVGAHPALPESPNPGDTGK